MKTEIIENFNNIELEKIKAARNFVIPDFKSGEVTQELQKGYKLKDRVLRPSMVKVNQ